jgi:hypothetical protein
MKLCRKCDQNKPLEEFGINKTKLDGKQQFCKECRKIYHRNWYNENKDLHKGRVKKSKSIRKLQLRKSMYEFLLKNPCVDCGESDPIVLDCDHIGEKESNIGDLLSRHVNWETIQKELNKCEVRCANCHRRKTAKQGRWYKYLRLIEKTKEK